MQDLAIILEDAIASSVLLLISARLILRYRKDGSVSALFMFLYMVALGVARICWLFLNGVVRIPLPSLAGFALVLTFSSIGFSMLFVSRAKVARILFAFVVCLSVLSFMMFPMEYEERLNGSYLYSIPMQTKNILLIPILLGFLPPAHLFFHASKALKFNLRMDALKPSLIALGFVLVIFGEIVFYSYAKGLIPTEGLRIMTTSGVVSIYAGFFLKSEI